MNKRMNDIFTWIAAHPNSTEREIASGVGLKKTPYTRQMLLNLIAEGNVVRVQDPNADRFTYRYSVQQTEQLL